MLILLDTGPLSFGKILEKGTNRLTNRSTDRPGHREVTLLINGKEWRIER